MAFKNYFMTSEQQEQFRKEFKCIVYQYSEIQSSNTRLKQLHNWDKNGSHDIAILKELDTKKSMQDKLKIMLKGHDYEEWKTISKRLTTLNSKLKNAIAQKEKAETEINKLTFQL